MPPDRSLLPRLARQAIAAAFDATGAPVPAAAGADSPWLRAAGACFVTLTLHGQLRGCIGSIRAWRPLVDDVTSNARAAAFSDPRFPPLRREELAAVHVEVSVLSTPEPVPVPAVAGEAAVLAALRPGVDGLVLEFTDRHGDAHATFLPQVWESLPAPRDFLARLKEKAGLPADFWSPELRLLRYTVESWEDEVDPRRPQRTTVG